MTKLASSRFTAKILNWVVQIAKKYSVSYVTSDVSNVTSVMKPSMLDLSKCG